MIERALRGMAVAVALLALVDPPLTVSGHQLPRLAIVVQGGPSMRLPSVDGRGSRSAVATRVRAQLGDALAGEFDIVDGADNSADALIVLGDRYPEEPPPETARVSTISLGGELAPNVAIVDVTAPRAIPPATAIRLSARVEGSRLSGQTTVAIVRAGGAEVGRASHTWSKDRETWLAQIDAVPVGRPPFTFEVSLAALPAEATALDNAAVVRVEEADRMRVLVLEARPSWATAFVRRAIESDPRFAVSGIGVASPRARVASGAAAPTADWLTRADDAALAAFDVVVAGGLEALPPATASILDRFMRERGGAVALVPDARIPAAVVREFMPGVEFREALLERPTALDGGLRAGELLGSSSLPAGAQVIAQEGTSKRAVVWTAARGDGLLFVSGALDAWRYRAESQGSFDRFWRSTLSGLALAARPAVDVTLSPRRAAVGERVRVVARVRSLERTRLGERLGIAGEVDGQPLRFWPDATEGTFSASFFAGQGPQSAARASLADADASGSAALTVDDHPRRASALPLALLAETRGGVDVGPANVPALLQHLRDGIASAPAKQTRHPMRSAWWLVPFSIGLGGEWWLRRRRGAR